MVYGIVVFILFSVVRSDAGITTVCRFFFKLFFMTGPQHIIMMLSHELMRDGVHNMYSREMEYTVFTNERLSPQHLLVRHGVYNIYP